MGHLYISAAPRLFLVCVLRKMQKPTASRSAQLHEHTADFKERVLDRQRSLDAQRIRLELLEKSSRQRAARAGPEREAREVVARDAAQKSREEADAASEARRRVARSEEWKDSHETTQRMLAVMRRSGVLPGVNPPSPPEKKDPPQETATHVTIRLLEKYDTREAILSKSITAGKRVSFNVDLNRFRDVEYLTGEQIGPLGVAFLAEQLCDGACPELMSLDLGWNGIRVAGVTSLMKALPERHVQHIMHLDLQANQITEIDTLGAALEDGALPRLAHLNLRHNPIGNTGAKALVHIILAGQLAAIEMLNISGCEIRDSGMKALSSGVNAQQLKKSLMPLVEIIAARDNRASAKLMRSLEPWPPFVVL